LFSTYATEGDIADETGGSALFSNNDLRQALLDVTERGGNYYTLSYSPSNSTFDGRSRKIHVELARHGYHLSYRRSYYSGISWEKTSQPVEHTNNSAHNTREPHLRSHSDSFMANIRYGAPLAYELFFKAHVHAVGKPTLEKREQVAANGSEHSPGKKQDESIRVQTYDVDLAITLLPPGGQQRSSIVQFATAAYDTEGRMLIGIMESANAMTSSPGEKDTSASIYHTQQRIKAPVNATSMRIVVKDVSRDRIGAMEVALPLAPEEPAQN